MKRIISTLLVVALAMSSVSCVVTTTDDDDKKDIVSVESDNDKSEGDKDNKSKTEESSASDETEGSFVSDEANESDDLSIEEQVLWETDGVKITATGLEDDSFWGRSVNVLVENNSDKDITVYSDAMIVNGYMIDDLTCIEVSAGNKVNDSINLFESDLEAAGIENIGQIEMYLHISDDDYNTIAESECITIKTSLFDSMDTAGDTDGVTLLEQDGIKIVGKYVDEDSFWGAAALLYIENNSDKNVTVRTEDVSINGFMITSFCYEDIYAGKKAFTTVDFLSSALEENNIESIDNIELSFVISDDNYNTLVETDKISFSTN